ncbi:ketopantoate reductase family protein [Bacillus spizizenii]|uniref:2-dehydropantoate 2-reductase n=1 Tax=Bacillus spizizenii TaxID=96241 RepID=A0A9Q4DPZ2_BACSC|nr:ketopantoate reductase family protein [Bacillus spizizenii]KFI04607.1 2-dehydropantoate 2-reductase [Bacillus sp. BSC154]MCY7884730.1 ketopantoate reductase family protein [Bacillus spizizenii]MCY7970763.1 ketopantoate reductase family protein [Bacillus spizizenii]MCY8120560.1 ketopantoate reductase family protein [Bacillus spizizenii]MCY8600064.1 ketopantoate reductase family protein [Bacillus spizizenii]
MKFLVVGAGGVGGYIGGRLEEKGNEVTFLVRHKRAEQLKETGLVIHSEKGDVSFQPALISAGETGHFDVVIIASKAYSLDQVLDDVKPFIGRESVIIPFLNGYRHYEQLFTAFSKEQVLGGLCFIESALNNKGEIHHTSASHRFVFGEWNGERTERITALEEAFSGVKAEVIISGHIEKDIWKKYLFIAAQAGITTLFQRPLGPILETEGGRHTVQMLIGEIGAILRKEGVPADPDLEEESFRTMTSMSYHMKSSMLRDMENGQTTEGDHLHGFLLEKAKRLSLAAPILETVYANLQMYEAEK